MFWQRIWSYLTGYVTLTVTGTAVEKFINMALSRGIYLWDIVWMEENTLLLKVRLYAVLALRHIARRTGSRFKIRAKKGLPFWLARFKKRKMLVAGAIFFLFMLYIYSSFVWTVEVRGLEKIPPSQVLAVARKAGVKPGLLKWTFDKNYANRQIADNMPGLAWVEVYIEGTKAVVEVVEKTFPPPAEEQGPAHVVAVKDGMVKGVLVLSGQALVKEGDTVEKGQVLISGAITPPEEENEDKKKPVQPRGKVTYLRAKGTVKARVWYEGYGEQSFVDEEKTLTGRVQSFIYIKIGQKEIILKGSRNPPFKNYKKVVKVKRLPVWRNIKVPVEVVTTVYQEEKINRRLLTLAQAKLKAQAKIERYFAKVIPHDAKRFPPSVAIIHAGDEKFLRLRMVLETEEQIGVAQSFQPSEERGGQNPIGRRNGAENSSRQN